MQQVQAMQLCRAAGGVASAGLAVVQSLEFFQQCLME